MQSFSTIIEGIEYQKGSFTTQVVTTTGSYRKVGLLLRPLFPTVGVRKYRVLDYGAGIGLGTIALQGALGQKFVVDSYEPAADRSQIKVTYNSSDQLIAPYDAIVCLNVLNVLELRIRSAVVRNILELLGPKGYAFIGVRKWSGDVNSVAPETSSFGKEDKSIWLMKKTKAGPVKVFQKGFDGLELVEYITKIAGEGYDVRRVSGIAGNSVLVTKQAVTPDKKK